MTFPTTTISRGARHRASLLFATFVVMVVTFGAPARGAASCPFGELVEFTDPVVTVVDGPGDIAQEQARWSKVGSGFMEGMLELYFDEQVFELEKVK